MTVAVAAQPARRPGRLARAARIGIGLVYLFGAPTHVYFALWNADGYRGMGEWSPPYLEASRAFWSPGSCPTRGSSD